MQPFPAPAAAVSGYITHLAKHGARVGTISRRLSVIKFAQKLRDLPDPADNARVFTVWEGIWRSRVPPEQAVPLMPLILLDAEGRLTQTFLHIREVKSRGRVVGDQTRRSSICWLAFAGLK